mgnify:CR=1 FL=1
MKSKAVLESAEIKAIAHAAEAEALEGRRAELADRLQVLLVPRDPLDDSDVILEIKAGEGGAEYIRRLQDEGWLRRVKHPGNFVFTWPDGRAGGGP